MEFINEVNNPCYLEELTVSAANECACCEAAINKDEFFCINCVGNDLHDGGNFLVFIASEWVVAIDAKEYISTVDVDLSKLHISDVFKAAKNNPETHEINELVEIFENLNKLI